MLLLVGEPDRDRPRRRGGGRLPWAPFPPLVLTVVLLLIAPALPPLAGAVAALGALASALWLGARLTGSWDGLREHRQ